MASYGYPGASAFAHVVDMRRYTRATTARTLGFTHSALTYGDLIPPVVGYGVAPIVSGIIAMVVMYAVMGLPRILALIAAVIIAIGCGRLYQKYHSQLTKLGKYYRDHKTQYDAEYGGIDGSSVFASDEDINSWMQARYKEAVSGKLRQYRQVTQAFRTEEAMWIYGALGEIHSAQDLDEYVAQVDGDVIHDIVLTHPDGTISANIDHVVFSDNKAIVCDTKVWADMPVIIRDGDKTYLDPRSDKHFCIDTCLYEIKKLGIHVDALVFIIRGQACNSVHFTSISDYMKKYDTGKLEGALYRCPIPVYFVHGDDIGASLDHVIGLSQARISTWKGRRAHGQGRLPVQVTRVFAHSGVRQYNPYASFSDLVPFSFDQKFENR